MSSISADKSLTQGCISTLRQGEKLLTDKVRTGYRHAYQGSRLEALCQQQPGEDLKETHPQLLMPGLAPRKLAYCPAM